MPLSKRAVGFVHCYFHNTADMIWFALVAKPYQIFWVKYVFSEGRLLNQPAASTEVVMICKFSTASIPGENMTTPTPDSRHGVNIKTSPPSVLLLSASTLPSCCFSLWQWAWCDLTIFQMRDGVVWCVRDLIWDFENMHISSWQTRLSCLSRSSWYLDYLSYNGLAWKLLSSIVCNSILDLLREFASAVSCQSGWINSKINRDSSS